MIRYRERGLSAVYGRCMVQRQSVSYRSRSLAENVAASVQTLAQGLTAVEVGQTKLLLVREGDDIRAFEGQCPHARAPLHEGALCDGRIICPWHMAAFDARSGALLEPVAMRGLTSYPLRRDGDRLLVDLSPASEARPKPLDEARVFVLAGAGAASSMAAVTLRDAGFAGRLVMVGPDAAEPLDRTQLSKMAIAARDFDRATLPLLDEAAWDALRLERVVASVVSLDRASRRLTLSTGETLRYDALLLATGARPGRLDVPGAGAPHVCTLRALGDVDAILKHVHPGGRAVVIGASFIGMEAASALVERGMAVTVIGQEDAAPFAKQFGERVGGAIRTLHGGRGVGFRLGVGVERIGPDSVVLDNGEILAAELVVVGTGVRPVLDYADGLARAEDGGLAVDASLSAGDGIWAAGDIASPDGWPRIEHWRLAQQHGRVAAMGMLGGQAAYEGVPFFWSAQHGKRLDYVGHASAWDDIAYDGDVEGFDFIAWYVKDGAVKAAVTCARDRATALLSQRLRSHLTLDEARRLVDPRGGPV